MSTNYIKNVKMSDGTSHNILGYKTEAIPFAKTDSSSTASAVTATVDGVTELKSGTTVWLWNNAVDTTDQFTLNVNGLGAAQVYVNGLGFTGSTANLFKRGTFAMFMYYTDSLGTLTGWVMSGIQTVNENLPTASIIYGGSFMSGQVGLTDAAKFRNGATSSIIALTNTSTGTGGWVANTGCMFSVDSNFNTFAGITFYKGDYIFSTGRSWVKITGSLNIDTSLSTSSGNPVQNSVVASAINDINETIGDINSVLEEVL